MVRRFHLVLILLFAFGGNAAAQDLHSAQEYALAPIWYPATTGRFDGLYRIGLGYRDQWRSVPVPFQTLVLYNDWTLPLGKGPQRGNSRFGFGWQVTGDRAGDGRLQTTEYGAQVAYHQALSREGKSFISAGVGVNGGQKRLDLDRLIFDSQWTELGFDPSLPNNEPNLQAQTGYLDVQAGLGLFVRTSRFNYVYADAALHHINRPTVSLMGQQESLGFRPLAAVGARFALKGTRALLPRVQFSTQREARLITAGANLAFGLDYRPDADQFIAGLWYRYGDAAIVNAGVKLGDWQFMASYGITASPVTRATNGNGAFEVTMIWVGQRPNRSLDCPSAF
jgi:type IX secretion system PorP/SprF family membrane protein